jgi:hypothetical protein
MEVGLRFPGSDLTSLEANSGCLDRKSHYRDLDDLQAGKEVPDD